MTSAPFWKRFLFGTILIFLSFCVSLGAQTKPIAVLGGTLIDGTGRAPVTDTAIVMQGGRFLQVGKRGQVSIPKGAEVIEAKGKTILPGLIDGHCHYTTTDRGELFLAFGVTTCPVLASDGSVQWNVDQREAIEKGKIQGPRLWITGVFIDGPPQSPSAPTMVTKFAKYGLIVKTPEEGRKAVRDLVEKGVDGLKFFERMTPETAKAAGDEARRLGRPVFGHTVDVLAAIDEGYSSIEHFWGVVFTTIQDPQKKEASEIRRFSDQRAAVKDHLYMSPEFYSHMEPKILDQIIKKMVDHNVQWCPTFATWFRPISPKVTVLKQEEEALLKDPRYAISADDARLSKEVYTFYEQATPQRRAEVMAFYNKLEDFVRRYVAAGGKIRAGSDPNHSVAGFALHIEMELLAEAGLSPQQVIQSASLNTAQAWRKDKDYGSVEQGKVADLDIVQGDATKDIFTTRNVEMVFKDGKLVGGSNYKKP